MANFKVLLTDTIHADFEVERSVVEAAGGEFLYGGDKSPEEFEKMVEEADAIVTVYTDINKELLSKAKNCKVVVRTGIGFNNIDIKAAGELGIYAANVPDYCFDEVSDHAIVTALTVARKVAIFDKRVKSGNWSHNGMKPIYAFRGRVFGLLSFGNISKYVAKKVKAFGFEVIAYDPFLDKQVEEEYGIKLVDLHTLFAESDILSLHAPLTEETMHIVNAETIGKMKSGSIIVNTARGPLIDEKALYEALISGKIAGAALDVMETEPPALDNPLLTLDNVIITPHAAFYSETSGIELRRKAFEEAVRGATGQKVKNCVNKKWLK